MLFIIEAEHMPTGSIDAILYVNDDYSVATDMDGKIIDGFDGPFFDPAWYTAMKIADRLFGRKKDAPTICELLRSGVITGSDVAIEFPQQAPNYRFRKKYKTGASDSKPQI